MPATIAAARAGATTGEWAHALREAFGSYRAPTGVGEAAVAPPGAEAARLRDVFGDYRAPTGVGAAAAQVNGDAIAAVRERVEKVSSEIGHRLRILVGKPGLDGHSNGAEQIAVRARDVGMEVIYQGIRLTPEQIVASAVDEDVDVIGLSILSGSHLELIPEIVRQLRARGVDAPVVVGGIIPEEDQTTLEAAGVAAVYTPKDFELARIMDDIASQAEQFRRQEKRA